MELTPWANPEDESEVLSRRTAQAMVVGRLRIEILSGKLDTAALGGAEAPRLGSGEDE